MRLIELESIERLNAIIRQQADLIDHLFLLYTQHVSAEEAEAEAEEIAKVVRAKNGGDADD